MLTFAAATVLTFCYAIYAYINRESIEETCPHEYTSPAMKLVCAAMPIYTVATVIYLFCSPEPTRTVSYTPIKISAIDRVSITSNLYSERVYFIIFVVNKDGSFSPEIVEGNDGTKIIEDSSLVDYGYWRRTYLEAEDDHYLWTRRPMTKLKMNELIIPSTWINSRYSSSRK